MKRKENAIIIKHRLTLRICDLLKELKSYFWLHSTLINRLYSDNQTWPSVLVKVRISGPETFCHLLSKRQVLELKE